MRLILIASVLLVVIVGACFAALNASSIPIDLYFVQLRVPAGAALLGCVLLGWLLGGLVAWFGQAPRLRRELRSAHAQLRAQRTAVRADEA